MLINLSNHPTEKWSAAQLNTVEYYYHQKILNMSFPDINPDWTRDEIAKFAIEYRDKIIDLNAEIVHIMGEMTFTYALINLLKDAGIKCIASTTKRSVQEFNGNKVSTFEFVQFREY